MTRKKSPPAAAPAAPPKKPARRVSGLTVTAISAIVLMSLVLVGLFWLRAQSSAPPSDEALVAQAAEAGGLAQAQQLLVGIEADRLPQLFAKTEAKAPDELSRQRLIALQKALHIPPVTLSLWDTLLSQKLIVVSLALAALPLLGALVISLVPVVQRMSRQIAGLRAAMPQAEVELSAMDAPAEASAAGAPLESALPPVPEPVRPTPPSVPLAAPVPPALPQTDGKEPPAEPHIQDILTSVFESEAGTTKYEALLRGLDYISASDLLAAGRRVARQLRAQSASPGNK